jgi:hypothetical protein
MRSFAERNKPTDIFALHCQGYCKIAENLQKFFLTQMPTDKSRIKSDKSSKKPCFYLS